MSFNSVHMAIAAIAGISMMAMYSGQPVPAGVLEALGAWAVARQALKMTKKV